MAGEGTAENEEAGIWDGDLFSRNADAERIEAYLVNRSRTSSAGHTGETRSNVLNVDAKWGQGKTFFMRRFAQALREKGYIVVEIDAWATDHADDPFIAVMAAIDQEMKPLLEAASADQGAVQKAKDTFATLSRNAVPVGKAVFAGAGKAMLKRLISDAVDEVEEILEFDDGDPGMAGAALQGAETELNTQVGNLLTSFASKKVREFTRAQTAIGNFKKSLQQLIEQADDLGKRKPMFVLIDELDRCRPPYAIAMLERVKHIFGVQHAAFLIATNTEQLTASIEAVYGPKFDAQMYLKRFFDRTYHLPDPSPEELAGAWIADSESLTSGIFSHPHLDLRRVIGAWFRAANLSLRSQVQCLDNMADVLMALGPRQTTAEHLVPLVIHQHLGLPFGGNVHQRAASLKPSPQPSPVVKVGRFEANLGSLFSAIETYRLQEQKNSSNATRSISEYDRDYFNYLYARNDPPEFDILPELVWRAGSRQLDD